MISASKSYDKRSFAPTKKVFEKSAQTVQE
jgi:hypothetical protein